MKHRKLRPQAERDRVCEENMKVLNAWKEGQRSIGFEWNSPIHLRIVWGNKWTDFWPTTGKWYDPYDFKKGTDVASLVVFLEARVQGAPYETPKAPGAPKPSAQAPKPTILERLECIEMDVMAIREALQSSKPSPDAPESQAHSAGSPEFSFMDDDLDQPPVSDEASDDDTPPWDT